MDSRTFQNTRQWSSKINLKNMALWKTEISEFFIFVSSGIIWLPKFEIYLEKPVFS